MKLLNPIIRALTRPEWPLLKELRLSALLDSPDQFGESQATASQRSEGEWAELIGFADPSSSPQVYVAEVESAAVGMVFAFRDPLDAVGARLGGMWVAPAARRSGVGRALVRAVLDWALRANKRRTRLWVVPHSPAERLYRSVGFAETGAQKPFPNDGTRIVVEMQYEFAGPAEPNMKSR